MRQFIYPHKIYVFFLLNYIIVFEVSSLTKNSQGGAQFPTGGIAHERLIK